jgi:DNA-binding transcriptional MerR regulator
MARTYTTTQAAKKAGITRQTLHFWVSSGLVKAPAPVKIGQRAFRLWTERDVQRLKEFKGTLHPGPKKARKQ